MPPTPAPAEHFQYVTVEKSAAPEFDARFVMSAASPDRVSDTIEPSAYSRAAAKVGKLIALFNHDPNQVAGFWTNLKRDKDTLTGSIKFASTNLGLMLRTLLDDGVPLGASIGFRGKGAPNDDGGIHFSEIELIETSIVSTPAHPRAMQIAKSFGIALSCGDPSATSRRSVAALAKARSVIARSNLKARADK